ncbi:MAG: hypothetical protein JJU36_04065 [Phycisphaeraceae bacterium]|nr:hypothetical protein [Phycisphaeraceae bacterium]
MKRFVTQSFHVPMLALLAACLGLLVAATPAQAERIQMTLVLDGALFHGADPSGRRASLMVTLLKEDGQWERVWGIAARYAGTYHPGIVTGATPGRFLASGKDNPNQTDDPAEIRLVMDIRGDSWVPAAGFAEFNVKLTEAADNGDVVGEFKGRFKGHEIVGHARASITVHDDDAGLSISELIKQPRPRVLFKKSELAELRQRAKTPFGRAAMEQLTDAVGLGVRYQLTGDADLAAQARRQVIALMADTDSGTKIDRARVWGRRLEQVALTFDLCYEAWDQEFRDEVRQYLLNASDRLYYSRATFHNEINWTIGGNYIGPILYGAALGGLSVLGETGSEPPRPDAPNTTEHIQADKDFAPAQGVPVVQLRPGEAILEWLVAGGFQPEAGDDPFRESGGPGAFRPRSGQELTIGKRTDRFKLIDPERGIFRGTVDLTFAAERIFYSNVYAYTAIENDAARWVRLDITNDQSVETRAWLGGVELRQGEVIRLDPGRHPLLIEARIGQTSQWGRIMMSPRLVELSAADARAARDEITWQHDRAMEDWQWRRDQWERLGRMDADCLDLFTLGRWMMYQQIRLGVGDGGFPAGDYSTMGLEGTNRYALVYRRMFGRDLSARPDVSMVIPRAIFSMLYPPDPEEAPFSQDINGPNELVIRDYIENRDVSGSYFAAMFPLVPERYQRAALWAWNRHVGISDESDLPRLLTRGPAFYPFLTYPLDMEPQHPREVMPLTWHAPHAGWFAFRNRHEGEGDALVQVIGGGHPDIWRRSNTGSFRIMGLGHVWAHGPEFRQNHFRWMENLVLLPEDEVNNRVPGKVIHHQALDDGSGTVTFDMSDVYAGRNRDARGREMPLFDRLTGLRLNDGWKDSGISGLRAVAVDYSGKSGAPVMVVIVDRVRGGGAKVWSWQLGGIQMYGGEGGGLRPRSLARGDLDKVSVNDHGFQIRKDNALLNARFVTQAAISAEQRGIAGDVWFKSDKDAGRGVEMHNNSVWARNDEGDFFVVLTIQDGPAPEMTVSGRGMDAAVTVGDRTVRFDGRKIVLGER